MQKPPQQYHHTGWDGGWDGEWGGELIIGKGPDMKLVVNTFVSLTFVLLTCLYFTTTALV